MIINTLMTDSQFFFSKQTAHVLAQGSLKPWTQQEVTSLCICEYIHSTVHTFV